ncbi:CPBP family intramembrane metalloprotease [candidate division KSB1 bacterium]|nr:CPBP family intramembrane metalloprotease [candidate division KSB1 bacterium]
MKVIRFYLLVFGYSWIVWLLGILFFNQPETSNLVVSIGGIGTIIGVISYWIFSYDKEQKQDYIKRLFRIRGVPIKNWLVAGLLPILIIIFSQLLQKTFGAFTAPIGLLENEFIEKGWMYILFLFLFGPVPEEMTWRGIALDELSKKSKIKAQIIVATMWALWHLPLFFIKGSYQNELGIGTLSFWMFFINVIFPSFIVGWLYLKSNCSILIAILYHFSLNLTGEMFYTTTQVDMSSTVITILVALIFLFEQILSTKRNKTIKLKQI